MEQDLISKIVSLLKQLPGVGPKTAERYTYFLLNNKNLLEELILKFTELRDKIKKCSLCNNFTDSDICKICSDENRDKSLLCIVEHPQDMYVIELTKSYNGLYYILGDVIEPLEGKFPKDLDLKSLVNRIKNSEVKEVILATDFDTEGELTANYIVDILSKQDFNIKFSRIARGLPSGAEIEYADPITLLSAIKNRIEIKK